MALPSITSPANVEIVSWQDTALNQTFLSTLTSTDGVTWTPVLGSTQAISLGTNYLAGLAATANSPRVTVPVVLNNVTLTATSAQPPGICPSGYTCDDIGSDILPGNQVYLNPNQGGGIAGTFTVEAGGSDIWSNYDNFRFISQSFPQDAANSSNGDGTISARVVSRANPGGPWMKTGVMIRSSATDPQAPYYGVFITPGNGLVVQWRTAEGAQSGQVLDAAVTSTPVYLLASRYTDTATGVVYYSAYSSADGVELDVRHRLDRGAEPARAARRRASRPTPTTRQFSRRRPWTTSPRSPVRSRRRSSARPPGPAPTSAARCRPARTS